MKLTAKDRTIGFDRLEREWRRIVLCYFLSAAGIFVIFHILLAQPHSARWLVSTCFLMVYPLSLLRMNLHLNIRQNSAVLSDRLGAGTYITLLRGSLAAFVGGFLFMPASALTDSEMIFSWMPGIFYFLAISTDSLDGFAARRTNHQTVLGALLDIRFDAFGIFVASLVAVFLGKLPWFYLFASGGFYLVSAAALIRKNRGGAVHPLRPRKSAKRLGGVQMFFVGASLLPVFPAGLTRPVAAVLLIPSLIEFVIDWLVITGSVDDIRSTWQRHFETAIGNIIGFIISLSRILFKARYLFLALVPLLFLWELQRVPLRAILGHLKLLTGQQLFLLLIVNLLIVIVMGGRWWIFLKGVGAYIPFLKTGMYRLAGFAVSYVTPGPQFGGEPLQIGLLKEIHDVPLANAAAALALDKLFEVVINFSFLLTGLIFIFAYRSESLVVNIGTIIFVFVLFLLPIILVIAVWKGVFRVSQLFTGLLHIVHRAGIEPGVGYIKLVDTIKSSEQQVRQLIRHRPGIVFYAFLISLLMWVGMIGEFWLVYCFLGLKLDIRQLIVLLTANRLAFLLPIPAGLGVMEAGQMLALDRLLLDPSVGLSAALVIRARDLLFAGAGLLYAMIALGRSSFGLGLGRNREYFLK